MPSDNSVVLASAGSGKTTDLVRRSCEDRLRRSALITYTINGGAELESAACRSHKAVPPHVMIDTWYSFVLSHLIRPYQNHLYASRVRGINFTDLELRHRLIHRSNTKAYYFSSEGLIWRDRATEFASQLIDATGGLPIRRIERIFDCIYIDEVQDLSGWDLEILDHLLKSKARVVLVGDCRQATYSTNNNQKNSAYSGEKIITKFREWEAGGLVSIEEQAVSWRCNQTICDFADGLYPDYKKTTSKNISVTGHDGVFLLRERDVDLYWQKYSPQPLRYDRRTEVQFGVPKNFGEVKGMTFDRTLVYPHGGLRDLVTKGKNSLSGTSLAKAYVGITRAKSSVAIVVPNRATSAGLPFFSPV